MINGGEIRIDPKNMEAIMKWLVHTNVNKLIVLLGKQCLQNFIASFSVVVAPHHTIAVSGKSFQHGG